MNGFSKKEPEQKELIDVKSSGESSKISRWSVFFVVFLGALITVIYVDNVLRIDGFLEDIQLIKTKTDFLKNENEMLKTKLNELQSPLRITKIATENLGMVRIESTPKVLSE